MKEADASNVPLLYIGCSDSIGFVSQWRSLNARPQGSCFGAANAFAFWRLVISRHGLIRKARDGCFFLFWTCCVVIVVIVVLLLVLPLFVDLYTNTRMSAVWARVEPHAWNFSLTCRLCDRLPAEAPGCSQEMS